MHYSVPSSSSSNATLASSESTAWQCLACGSQRFSTVLPEASDVLTGKKGIFAVVSCADCKLHSTSPVLNEAQLAYYYQSVYSNTSHRAAQRWQTGWIGRWLTRYRLRMIARVKPLDETSRVLDVGCGYGGFVLNAHALTGCVAEGLDSDAGSITQAAQAAAGMPRIHFKQGGVDTASYAAEQFDVICLFQSLEHHLDPFAALQTIRPWLKPGGLCVIEVPNFAGLWRHVFGRWWLPLLVPQHRVHFTPQSLRTATESVGFQTALHKGMFFPTEATISVVLWLNHCLGKPIRSYKLSWRRPLGLLIAAFACVWWCAVELPLQLICLPFNRTGHQILIAKKPLSP
jgi:2-polyprenyl-3-methyl-5-hydroxy-6-metoxy-1,4-benzoquinol methylase